MKTFKNKVAVVTGTAGGIGQALTIELARRGAHIAHCDVADLDGTNTLLNGYDTRNFAMTIDIGKKSDRKKFVSSVLKEFGHVDVLINNAGIALGDRTFEEVTEADFEKITNINYWGVVHTTQLLYPHMLKRPEAAIANISSTQGILAAPYLNPYCTTKFAVRGFTDSLRVEHQVREITNLTFHTVHPGAVATNITLNADYQGKNTEMFHKNLQKGSSPSKAANIILDGIKKNKSRIFISEGKLQDLTARLFPEHLGSIARRAIKFTGGTIR